MEESGGARRWVCESVDYFSVGGTGGVGGGGFGAARSQFSLDEDKGASAG